MIYKILYSRRNENGGIKEKTQIKRNPIQSRRGKTATNEARKEVIKLLGGVISGMNVGQPVIMQAANSEAQEPTEDVMDDADVAGLAMGWMF